MLETGWCGRREGATGHRPDQPLRGLLHMLQEVWYLLKSNKNVYECVLFFFLGIRARFKLDLQMGPCFRTLRTCTGGRPEKNGTRFEL